MDRTYDIVIFLASLVIILLLMVASSFMNGKETHYEALVEEQH